VAEQLVEFKQTVDAKIEKGEKKERAIYETIRELIKWCKPIRFDGNGYSDEWRAEAALRGLDCETSTPIVFDRYLDKSTIKMFKGMGVYNKIELEARTEIKWETYVKKVQIEARVLGDLAMNNIVPIASKYVSVLLDKAWKLKELGLSLDTDMELINNIQNRTAKIQTLVHDMVESRKRANRIEQMREKAIAYHDTVSIYLNLIRDEIDRLEEVIDDQIWTLPKYREILYIK
jgi:glutamine synthetase